MAMSSAPKIRNLQHTSFDELELDDEELADVAGTGEQVAVAFYARALRPEQIVVACPVSVRRFQRLGDPALTQRSLPSR